MNRQETGKRGEQAAQDYYLARGYTLCAANYRTRHGEVDLILEREGMFVFAEVKARGEGAIAAPREWVNAPKQRRVIAAALAWLAGRQISEPPMRFDVVEVLFEDSRVAEIRCIENAFGG